MPFIRLIKYTGINGAILPLNVGSAAVLTYVGAQYLLATLVGVALQATIVFFINRHWTFQAQHINASGGLVRTWLVELGSITIVLGTTMVLVEMFLIEFTYARLCAIVTAGAWGFLADSIFTFRTNPFR